MGAFLSMLYGLAVYAFFLATFLYAIGFVGNLFVPGKPGGTIKRLPPMPDRPTIYDFFALRFAPANHVLQSAALAMKNGMT